MVASDSEGSSQRPAEYFGRAILAHAASSRRLGRSQYAHGADSTVCPRYVPVALPIPTASHAPISVVNCVGSYVALFGNPYMEWRLRSHVSSVTSR